MKLRPNDLVFDPSSTLPEAESVYRVTDLDDTSVGVINVSRPSVSTRWPLDSERVAALRKVRDEPVYLVDLDPILTRRVRLDLVDGGRRTGTITRVEYQRIRLFGVDARIPRRLILDNDGADWIEWTMIAEIREA